MKKLMSLILCIAVMVSMLSMITVSADEMPEFSADFYVVNIAHENKVITENVVPQGSVVVSGSWSSSTATADMDLGNGELLDYHYYTKNKSASATYTFTNVPAGQYEVEYLVSHGNSYYYLPLDITCNGTTNRVYVGSLDSTSNLSKGWHTVTTIDLDAKSDVTALLTVPDVTYASNQQIRTAAMRLKSLAVRTEYVIRNTTVNKTADSNGTFELEGTWKDSSNNYTLDGISAKQIYSTVTGSSAKYNFLKTETPIFNNANYTGIEEGWYDVYFYYPQWTNNDDPAMGVEVYHDGTSTTYTRNLTTYAANAWNIISDVTTPLYFTGDGTEYVKLSNGTEGKNTRIGAIKLIKKVVISEEEPDVEIKDLVSNPAYNEGTLTIVTNGSSIDTETTVYAVVATYSDDGKILEGVKTTPITIAVGADDTAEEITLPETLSQSSKLFVLYSLTSAKPLITSFDF